MFNIFIKCFVSFLVTLPGLSFSENQEFLVQNGVPRLSNPVDANGKAAPGIFSYKTTANGGTSLFIVTGTPAENLTRKDKPNVKFEQRPANLIMQFSDLRFIVNDNFERTAAFYPLKPLKTLHIGSAHALQRGRFEIPSDERVFGLLDPANNTILDLAIRADNTSVDLIEAALNHVIDSEDNLTKGYVDHLNVVKKPEGTAKEFILSESRVNVVSHNQDYIFFRSDQNTLIGPASSGAIIYNTITNKPHSLVVCTTQIKQSSEQSVPVIRAIKLNTIKRYKLIELTETDLQLLKKLDCENHEDGRRGGG